MVHFIFRMLSLIPVPLRRDPGTRGGSSVRGTGPWARVRELARRWWSPASRRWTRVAYGEAGTSTAEYAIATLAAVAFAGLLVVIMRSDEVRGFLLNIIRTALAIP